MAEQFIEDAMSIENPFETSELLQLVAEALDIDFTQYNNCPDVKCMVVHAMVVADEVRGILDHMEHGGVGCFGRYLVSTYCNALFYDKHFDEITKFFEESEWFNNRSELDILRDHFSDGEILRMEESVKSAMVVDFCTVVIAGHYYSLDEFAHQLEELIEKYNPDED
jgi:hypothetical protein